jgi:hypothetical protein
VHNNRLGHNTNRTHHEVVDINTTIFRTESLNEKVLSGMGSPLVKAARESTPNDLTNSSGAIRVAPSAKSEAVQGRIPSKGRRLPNCLFRTQTLSVKLKSLQLCEGAEAMITHKGQ